MRFLDYFGGKMQKSTLNSVSVKSLLVPKVTALKFSVILDK